MTDCPEERWQDEARAWEAAAYELARICMEQVGCAYDNESHPCDGQCISCWASRAMRKAKREDRHA